MAPGSHAQLPACASDRGVARCRAESTTSRFRRGALISLNAEITSHQKISNKIYLNKQTMNTTSPERETCQQNLTFLEKARGYCPPHSFVQARAAASASVTRSDNDVAALISVAELLSREIPATTSVGTDTTTIAARAWAALTRALLLASDHALAVRVLVNRSYLGMKVGERELATEDAAAALALNELNAKAWSRLYAATGDKNAQELAIQLATCDEASAEPAAALRTSADVSATRVAALYEGAKPEPAAIAANMELRNSPGCGRGWHVASGCEGVPSGTALVLDEAPLAAVALFEPLSMSGTDSDPLRGVARCTHCLSSLRRLPPTLAGAGGDAWYVLACGCCSGGRHAGVYCSLQCRSRDAPAHALLRLLHEVPVPPELLLAIRLTLVGAKADELCSSQVATAKTRAAFAQSASLAAAAFPGVPRAPSADDILLALARVSENAFVLRAVEEVDREAAAGGSHGVRSSSSTSPSDAVVELRDRRIGIAVYAACSLFNHSCEPAAVAAFDGARLTVRTLRAVPPGGALTIAYAEASDLPSRLDVATRRATLFERWHFECACDACLTESAGVGDRQRSIGRGGSSSSGNAEDSTVAARNSILLQKARAAVRNATSQFLAAANDADTMERLANAAALLASVGSGAGAATSEHYAACDALAAAHARERRYAFAAQWLAAALAGIGVLLPGGAGDVATAALAARPSIALDVWKLAQLRHLCGERAAARALARSAEPTMRALLPSGSPELVELQRMLAAAPTERSAMSAAAAAAQ